MDIKKELEATRKKLAALEVLAGEETSEEKAESSEEVKETPEKEETPEEETSEESDDEGIDKLAAHKVSETLDEIAGHLEDQNDPELLKLAYEIDLISDVLDGNKEASVLQSDKDEPYVKDHFQAGVDQRDSDEKYMDEFKTDTSAELQDKAKKKQVGNQVKKEASELPYQKIS